MLLWFYFAMHSSVSFPGLLRPPPPLFCSFLPKCKQITHFYTYICMHIYIYKNACTLSKLCIAWCKLAKKIAMKREKVKTVKHVLYAPQNNHICPAFSPLWMTDRRHRCQAGEVIFQWWHLALWHIPLTFVLASSQLLLGL